jgi:hypothetical protein
VKEATGRTPQAIEAWISNWVNHDGGIAKNKAISRGKEDKAKGYEAEDWDEEAGLMMPYKEDLPKLAKWFRDARAPAKQRT